MRFRLLGGHIALDFVNTVGGRVHSGQRRYEVEREHLESASDVYEWAAEVEAITAAEQRKLTGVANSRPKAVDAFFARALQLRESLYRIFSALAAERRPDAADLALLNRELATAHTHERLALSTDGVSLGWATRDAADLPLWIVARAAAELLTSPEVAKVRRCGGESCGWLFLDTSRNRSRQWCDMRDCGNIAKVRRFRERQGMRG